MPSMLTIGLLAGLAYGVSYGIKMWDESSDKQTAQIGGFDARLTLGVLGLIGAFVIPGIGGLAAMALGLGATVPPMLASSDALAEYFPQISAV